MTDLVISIVAGAAIVVGVAGTVLPVLPGLALVWAAMLVYGLLVGFGWFGWVAMALGTTLAALGMYLGVRIPQRRAAGRGLTVGAQLVALALAVAGFFVVPVVGAPFGFVLGVFLVRWRASGDPTVAWADTRSAVGSLVRASFAQAVCGISMGVLWLIWALIVLAADG